MLDEIVHLKPTLKVVEQRTPDELRASSKSKPVQSAEELNKIIKENVVEEIIPIVIDDDDDEDDLMKNLLKMKLLI
jgi:hypothetical protein